MNSRLSISLRTRTLPQPKCLFYVPLGTIQSFASKQNQNKSKGFGISIVCKDMRYMKFSIDNIDEGLTLLKNLKQFVYPNKSRIPLFAYIYGDQCLRLNLFPTNGWNVYVPEEEYKRQNISKNGWRITYVNSQYSLCSTYPSVLAVPAAVEDSLLFDCSYHRSRDRIPVLSWLHPENMASLTRCSQPQVGVQGRRNAADEELIRQIRKANPNAERLLLYDARSQLNAIANMSKGGGIESTSNYSEVKCVFLKIANIHSMRTSQAKVFEACFPQLNDHKWLKALSDSKWLKHIKHILVAATNTADNIENKKTSILIHCSDGWDRTPQVSSLAMIMLDPYYRTIRGFEVLIEKEWVSFGHKFCQRIAGPSGGGHLIFPNSEYNDEIEITPPSLDERSPVFLQFIECVWQVALQFPHAFEFNEHFLIFILDELYASRFGNFLFDNEREAKLNHVHSKTISIWAQVNSDLRPFQNPLYTPAEISGYHAIFPINTMAQLRFWTGYYLRWDPSMQIHEPVAQVNADLMDKASYYRESISVLQHKHSISMLGTEKLKNGDLSTMPRPVKPKSQSSSQIKYATQL